MFATVINKLKEAMEAEVPRIFEACFECTLQMITKNFEVRQVGIQGEYKGKYKETNNKATGNGWLATFGVLQPFVSTRHAMNVWWSTNARLQQDYPEHRLQFFSLLRAISNHCFNTLFQMNPAQLKLVIDSIVWAFRYAV